MSEDSGAGERVVTAPVPPHRGDVLCTPDNYVSVVHESPDGRAASSGPFVTIVPEWVRFQDVNPFTGTPYARSRFADLPGYAAWVVTDVLDLTAWTWDALVCSGEVAAVAASYSYFRVTDWLGQAAERQTRPAEPWECPECWGTCVAFDVDASLTGAVGTPVVCWCAEAWRLADALYRAEQAEAAERDEATAASEW